MEKKLKPASSQTGEQQQPASMLPGTPLADCTRCPHRALLEQGGCVPGDICIKANSGRQIDRFLRRHPEYAEHALNDDFWERRAIAARYASLEAVLKQPRDEDEVVRRVVASRLSPVDLSDYIRDSDREVRMTVAERLPPDALGSLIADEDYLVRLQVARRLPHGQLPKMAQDPDREVRKEVARRLPSFALRRMANDEDAEVRRIAASRMLPEDAAAMLVDEDWLVRLEASQRAPLENIVDLVNDSEEDVRAVIYRRLGGFLREDET
jgi:hypothetical protein